MTRPSNYSSLLIYLGLCLATLAFGGLFTPGEWYQSLQKAPWTPPNIAFPIVWSVLYLLIAIAGWRIALAGATQLTRLWFVQLGLNALWSFLFFGQEQVTLALIDICILSVVVAVMIRQSLQLKLSLVAVLLSPYLVWLVLASSLNAYIFFNN